MTREEENEVIRKREEWFSKSFSRLQKEIKYNITKTTGPMADYNDDLTQIAVLQFLNKPLEVQKQMLDDNKVENYILVTAGMHIRSSSSPFYNQVRKHKMSTRSGAMPDITDEDDEFLLENQDWYKCFQRALDGMHFYYRQLLLDKYQDQLSFNQMKEKYNINFNSLTNDTRAALKYVRCKCDPDYKC